MTPATAVKRTAEKPLKAEPAASTAAVVVVTTIKRVLTATPLAIGPAMLAHSP